MRKWWTERWLQLIKEEAMPLSVQQGYHYFHDNKVLQVSIGKASLSARVIGSKPRPYQVDIRFIPFDDGEWDRVITCIAEEAGSGAALLNGKLKESLHQKLAAAKLSLLPESMAEMELHCTCDDPSSACKHVAAVWHFIAQQLDINVDLLFDLRGKKPDDVWESLRDKRSGSMMPHEWSNLSERMAQVKETQERYRLDDSSADMVVSERLGMSRRNDSLLSITRLPGWNKDISLQQLLSPVYQKASDNAHRLLRTYLMKERRKPETEKERE